VHPDTLREVAEQYGPDRWPDSIACRAVYRILDPPNIDRVFAEPRLVTGTRGRYLADLSGAADLFDRLADLEVEELRLYRSPQYIALANQPRQASRRQARWASTVPPSIQGILNQKVQALFASAGSSGGVYEHVRPERQVPMDQTPMLLMLLEGSLRLFKPLARHRFRPFGSPRVNGSERSVWEIYIKITPWRRTLAERSRLTQA
jgi:hypothetical protein